MENYFKNFIRTKKKIIILIFSYLTTLLLSYKVVNTLVKPPIIPIIENNLLMPSHDALFWKDTPKGIILQEIHNPYVNQLEIGDVLIKIDQQPIFSTKSLNEILKSLLPGSVLMYQIKRPPNNEMYQILVRTIPKVIFKPETAVLQWFYQIINITCLFAGILLILLLYPFLIHKSTIYHLFFATIFWIGFNLLYLILDLQPTIYQEKTEIYFHFIGWVCIFLMLVLANIALQWKNFKLDFIIDNFLAFTLLGYVLYQKNIISYQFDFQLLAIVLTLKSLILYSIRESINERYLAIHIFTFIIILWLVFAPNFYVFTFLWIYLFGFELYWIYKYLKISKVNLVTQQFVLIIILISVFGISYSLSGLISKQFPYDFQNIVKIIFSFMATFMVIYFLFLNKDWWKKLLFFNFETRAKKLQNFQISMIHYLNKEQLIEDFKKEIKDFLGDVKIQIKLNLDEQSPYKNLIQYLNQDLFWSRSKELLKTKINIPENIQANIEEPWELIFPLIFSSQNKGLIFIGKKKEGYYNLEEAEILQRTIIQLSLIINLLTLLEKEKLLVQKTLEANLTALRSQINPHFLFNTLNTISSLIHDSPDLAEEAVEHLAFIFRYTLKTSSEQFSPLKSEMELIKHYLYIEKIRFGKKLNIDIQVQEECLNILIPSLVIQTLVENCIKHGISKLTKDGIIKIHFHIEGNFLNGIIYDNGPGIKKENIHKGTGLTNIITRLNQIYGNDYEIHFNNLNGGGTEIQLRIPLKK